MCYISYLSSLMDILLVFLLLAIAFANPVHTASVKESPVKLPFSTNVNQNYAKNLIEVSFLPCLSNASCRPLQLSHRTTVNVFAILSKTRYNTEIAIQNWHDVWDTGTRRLLITVWVISFYHKLLDVNNPGQVQYTVVAGIGNPPTQYTLLIDTLRLFTRYSWQSLLKRPAEVLLTPG